MAITWGKATKNPVKEVKLARANNGRVRWLTEEEETRWLAHCSPQLRPIVITALHSGFRAAELLSITWVDVDFSRSVITVRAAYAKNGDARGVPMNAVLTEMLQAMRMNAADDGAVFCNRNGTPYRAFRSIFVRAVEKAGLEDFTFHDLRHTFASRLVMCGVDLATVKELMGHKNISMTLRYAHLSAEYKQRAVRALEQFGHGVPTKVPIVAQESTKACSQVIDFISIAR